ncbi:FtsW/RodA/SpoVE family cell cycle protein [Crocosphaera sp. UHCC 0190]|uniref:FtsW/RodA/SpoVE family cell cycle protein n=1 Tax=Crocosphaera sp. UHCC 0190 TaxID=3110246 RepID=UPI002B217425|nr:FtsW/RodA/SpoVE family cell cycle protein [Crocosphaera sp. UHCC 0190]MEA5512070.1 FtsW/RodA/SpoVE family cell cycle protein [Crocosphaera sp. UHCC 0190]
MLRKLILIIFPIVNPDLQHWSNEARFLRWLTLLWLSLGLIALFSASYPVALAETGNGWYYVFRQAIWIWAGLHGFNLITRSPLQYIIKLAPWSILLLLGLILSTLVPGLGHEVYGATRWIKLGPILIQPSELMKPFLVLQSAYIFGQWHRHSWRVRLQWIGVFGLVLAGILLQPNLSTTALCGMSLWLIALASGIPSMYLTTTALGGILTAFVSISFREYQRKRITAFLDPWADPLGNGYQLVQSLMAVGSGGTFGVGYGMSQQKLFYLPIQYTDFIFSVYAEEFGFVGSIVLLILLLTYATFALRVAVNCSHRVKRLVAIGVMVMMVGQALLNIGVATGALPTTGLPFPLWSYGGSSTLASLTLAALLIRVARESNEAEVVMLPQKA